MIKNIIFDMDGVFRLIKEDPIEDVLPENLKTKCLAEDKDLTVKQFYTKYFLKGDIFDDYDKGKVEQELVINRICETRNVSKEFVEFMFSFRLQKPNNIFFEETFKLARELKQKGYSLYVLSNMNKDLADKLKIWIDKDLFNDVIYSCDVGMVKPNSDFFAHAIKKWNISPTESVFVDDRAENLVPFSNLGGETFLFDRFNLTNSTNTLRRKIYESNI